MTLLAVIAVAVAGYGVLVYVIAHLLADNRRLTAAVLAPTPAQALHVLTADAPKRKRAVLNDSDREPNPSIVGIS